MGRRATGTVEPLKTAIRLKFTLHGSRCIETLALDPTPANIKAAERVMGKVQTAIAAGYYRRSDFFTTPGAMPVETFGAYADAWLETLVKAKSTKRSYRTAFDATWRPDLGDKMLGEIRYSAIQAVIAKRSKTVSGKTLNNALVPLRGVFETAIRDGLIEKNPCDGIENLSHQSPEPDPFTMDERDGIVAHMRAKHPADVVAYFTLAFMTGMRPSELIALQWGDVDWRRRKIRVQRAIVDWEAKGTKTNVVRDVDLTADAVAALQDQKARTFLLGESAEIFQNPITRKPWPDEQVQRRRYYTPTLKALGLRQRDAYQTRHTFASLALMGGVNIGYISLQLGHKKITTTLNVYARWIEGADKGSEAAKLDAILSTNRPRKAGND